MGNSSARRDEPAILEPGDRFSFGRAGEGVGLLPARFRGVSRVHGVIEANDDDYSVEAMGKFLGFVVVDRTTPSQLFIAAGTGPITIPFAHAAIEIVDGSARATLEIYVEDSPRAETWAQRWAQNSANEGFAQPAGLATLEPVRPKVRKKNGATYAWFPTLVALCEPRLLGHDTQLPTNAELAARLRYAQPTIENHIESIYRALKIHAGGERRSRAVAVALGLGVVTRNDLDRIDG